MFQYYLNIIIYTVIMVPYTVIYFRKHRINPVSLFLFMQLSFFYGICFAPKGQWPVSIKLETLYVFADLFFVFGVEFGKRVRFSRKTVGIGAYTDEELSRNQRLTVWIITGVSILACLYFFAAGGINVFLESLKDFFRGDTESYYQNEREQFFNISGVGYIYQFRTVLLPICSAYFLFAAKRKIPKIAALGLFVLMTIFLLGTGQRNAFVFVCAILVVYFYLMRREYRIKVVSKMTLLIFGFAAVLFLVVLTISNKRVSGADNAVLAALESLVDRFLGVNQRTAITAFRYIDTQPTVWGYDWWMMMMDILPGKSGYLSVDRIVFYMAYGNYSGTGPPCLWGSAWYNFNILGVTIFPLLLGYLYQNVYQKMRAFPRKNRMYMLLYAALCVYLGIWAYGTPMMLFNNGVVTVLLMRWILFTFIPKGIRRDHL